MAGMQALQGQLVTNGFQLIHVPYPIPKKSAADIAMVADATNLEPEPQPQPQPKPKPKPHPKPKPKPQPKPQPKP